jgi:L-ascorbate metabolism protein UlaG (beta-lactamase superfamily)
MISGTKWIVIAVILLLLLFVFASPALPQKTGLEKSLKQGEALITYLHHSGWAVKTLSHFLIFDYIEQGAKPVNAGLANGWIDLDELQDQNILVFISHAHGDHFDRSILAWENQHDQISFIFGWDAEEGAQHIRAQQPRAHWKLGNVEILTVNHDFDGIPEAAFLVKLDGLVIYHSGDHGSTGPVINPVFKDNIDYLAQQTQSTDFAFISQFGSRSREEVNIGDLYTINTLRPTITFPMHRGGGEDSYKKFAIEAQQKEAKTQVIGAEARGDRFFYANGVIAKLTKGEHDE